MPIILHLNLLCYSPITPVTLFTSPVTSLIFVQNIMFSIVLHLLGIRRFFTEHNVFTCVELTRYKQSGIHTEQSVLHFVL